MDFFFLLAGTFGRWAGTFWRWAASRAGAFWRWAGAFWRCEGARNLRRLGTLLLSVTVSGLPDIIDCIDRRLPCTQFTDNALTRSVQHRRPGLWMINGKCSNKQNQKRFSSQNSVRSKMFRQNFELTDLESDRERKI